MRLLAQGHRTTRRSPGIGGGGTFRSQGGQELSPVWLCADITEVPVTHSSALASSVPPRPRSRTHVSEPACRSRSRVEDDAVGLGAVCVTMGTSTCTQRHRQRDRHQT